MRIMLLSVLILSLSLFVSCNDKSSEPLPNKSSERLKKDNEESTATSVPANPSALDSAPKKGNTTEDNIATSVPVNPSVLDSAPKKGNTAEDNTATSVPVNPSALDSAPKKGNTTEDNTATSVPANPPALDSAPKKGNTTEDNTATKPANSSALDSVSKEGNPINDPYNDCRDINNKITKCTTEQIATIKELEKITDDLIKLSKNDDLENAFVRYNGERYDNTKKIIYILGEFHNDLELLKHNFAFIIKHARPDDIVLFEGAEYLSGQKYDALCNFVLKIYSTDKYLQSIPSSNKTTYDPIALNNFVGSNVVPKIISIKPEFTKIIATKKLPLSLNYWDLTSKEISTPTNSKSERISKLIKRNDSMIKNINLHKNQSSVFVVAGRGHLPVGEYIININESPSSYSYFMQKNIKTVSSMYDDENLHDSFSAKNIYEAFKDESISYIIYKSPSYDQERDLFPTSL